MSGLRALQCLVLGLLLLPIPLSAGAQAGSETVSLSGAFTVDVPEDWIIDYYMASGYFWKTDSSNIRIRTYSPWFQRYHEVEDSVAGFMEHLVTNVFETRGFDRAKLETVQFGEHTGIGYTYEEILEGRRFLRAIFLYQLDNGFIVAGYISPISGHDLDENDVASLKAALATVSLQDTFIFYEGTRLDIPERWELSDDINERFAQCSLRTDTVELSIVLWPRYGAMAGLEKPIDFLAYIFNSNFGDIERLNRSKMETTRVAGSDAALYRFSRQTVNAWGAYDRAVIAFNVPTNSSAFTVLISTQTLDEPIDSVYELLDTIQPGSKLVCALFASSGIRIREQPSTSSPVVRQTEREVLVATRKTTDSANYVWFDVGEGWIRSDVIFYENNACAGLPVR